MRHRGAAIVVALVLVAALPGAAVEVVSRFVDVDGIRLHVLDSAPGRADLPTVLFVHGWAGCATDFRPLLERVGGARRWVAFDFPGCGESDMPDIHYSITSLAAWVEAVRAALGAETVDLVGHSLGGQVAIHYAVREPGRVRRLVVIDPDGLEGEEGFWLRVARLPRLVDFAFALNSRGLIRGVMQRRVFYGGSGLEEVLDGKSYLLTPGGNRAVKRITEEAIGTEPVDELLPRVFHPTLLVWGVQDRLLPVQWAGEWLRGLPRVEWCPIGECGHMPPAEKPVATAAALEEFLDRP